MFRKKGKKQLDNRKIIIDMSRELYRISDILKAVYSKDEYAKRVFSIAERISFAKPSVDEKVLKKDESLMREIDEIKLLISKSKKEINEKDLDHSLKNLEVLTIERVV